MSRAARLISFRRTTSSTRSSGAGEIVNVICVLFPRMKCSRLESGASAENFEPLDQGLLRGHGRTVE
ncbi:MAG TPA: hypothetical protein VKI44_16850, partial [Acetobacteraceae bacterium]|nr:hypothetical protein [Acetobacteraceae bacterium]